ncbi:hypothetical protein [Methylophaga muralis]|uniref:Capsule polysaccharide biosynthesis protein n=1 Tax=Methylophaga muralis TaxID=291169 RepID=A0A1E3GPM4_9GAMM|nr:hypothetical protein [Methylophaga muralis]ODN65371.1 Capsule polysaccharide biosynthesis protein [Methylophaga muralis]
MVLSPWHTNQLAVIEALAKSIPHDAILVVKENPAMLGLRPKDFYETICSFPRVVLINPYSSGLNWIKKTDMTVVITGTAAWEALRLKKPVIVIGDSPFLHVGEGVIIEPCLSNLNIAIQNAFKIKPASDEAIIKLLWRH